MPANRSSTLWARSLAMLLCTLVMLPVTHRQTPLQHLMLLQLQ
jgi:hypothetical protein